MLSLEELEKQRYDRQIRVWGNDAQRLIQDSLVLICGLRGLHSEVVKNIVLAGVNLVIQDDSIITEEDLATGFLVQLKDVGRNYAEAALEYIQQLNSFARVSTEVRSLASLNDEYFHQFKAILLDNVNDVQAVRISRACRSAGASITMFNSGAFAQEAWFISDYGDRHSFYCDPPKNKTLKTVRFPSIENVYCQKWSELGSRLRALPKTYVKSRLLQNYYSIHGQVGRCEIADADQFVHQSRELLCQQGLSESFLTEDELRHLASLCCVACMTTVSLLGSVLAQEVIKAVSRSGEPAYNMVVYSGIDFIAREFAIAEVASERGESSTGLAVVDACSVDDDTKAVVDSSVSLSASSLQSGEQLKSTSSAPAAVVMDLVDDDDE